MALKRYIELSRLFPTSHERFARTFRRFHGKNRIQPAPQVIDAFHDLIDEDEAERAEVRLRMMGIDRIDDIVIDMEA